MKIRSQSTLARALAAAALCAPAPALALTCYMVLDRNDNVVYRDTYPPIDLSDRGASEREQMRRRGEQLIAMESDRCPTLEFFLGNAGSSNLNVDQVVAGMQVRNTVGAASGTAAGPSSSGSSPTGKRAAPPAPAAPAKKY